jgi:hypothetical protein
LLQDNYGTINSANKLIWQNNRGKGRFNRGKGRITGEKAEYELYKPRLAWPVALYKQVYKQDKKQV